MAKYFYEKSNIVNFKSNIYYKDLVAMNDEEMDQWIDQLRGEVIDQWNDPERPTPPTIGKNEDKIISSFQQCRDYDISGFIHPDPTDDECISIINNQSKVATPVNQFFPAMLKTKIAEGISTKGAKAIYDWFNEPSLKDQFKKRMIRTLIKDSMCTYTKSLHETKNEWIEYDGESIPELLTKYKDSEDVGFFFRPYESSDLEKTVAKYNKQKYVVILSDEIQKWYSQGIVTDEMVKFCGGIDETIQQYKKPNGKDVFIMYLLRVYRKDFKLFPKALQTFRLGLGQPAVNFPALTARWLYEHYTKHIPEDEKVIVYDSSAGWGGRIIGAMSVDRSLHYVGTDPNTENLLPEVGISRYEYVADFFNQHTGGTNTFEIFQDGSELIHENPDFEKYKGKLDFVFTSPPYFNREMYSGDETQSYMSHSTPEEWVMNFLKPTLETAYEYLKKDRFLCWNIANIQIGKGGRFPDGELKLETYTQNIMKKLGAKYMGKHKILMTRMLGLDTSKLQNAVLFNGNWHKHEPVLVFYKSKP